MIHLFLLVSRVVGIIIAAGVQPLAILLVLAFAGRYNVLTSEALLPLSSTAGLVGLTGILILHLFHWKDRSGLLSGFVARVQLPMALTAGGVAAIAIFPHEDPSLPLFAGALGAGLAHLFRSMVRHLIPSFRLVAIMEAIVAGILLVLAWFAPVFIPICAVVAAILFGTLGYRLLRWLARRIVQIIFGDEGGAGDGPGTTARNLSWLHEPSSMASDSESGRSAPPHSTQPESQLPPPWLAEQGWEESQIPGRNVAGHSTVAGANGGSPRDIPPWLKFD